MADHVSSFVMSQTQIQVCQAGSDEQNNTDMQLYQSRFRAMGSPCQCLLYASSLAELQQLLNPVVQCIETLEQRYSRFRPDSLLSQINATAGTQSAVTIDQETQALLHYADQAYQLSDGMFDITAGVLYQAWDFKGNQIPSQQAIDQLLPLVGWDQVLWQEEHICLPVMGMALDLGGIVKEYAVDRAANILINQGVTSGLVDLGGDIHVIGPHLDGQPWRVAINNPWQPGKALLTLGLEEGGMASSGLYERYIDYQGKRYAHILNPKTGWPVAGLVAATVCAPQCLVAGTSTTVALLKEAVVGQTWLQSLGIPYWSMGQDKTIDTNMMVTNISPMAVDTVDK